MFSQFTQILLDTHGTLDIAAHRERLFGRIQELQDEIKALERSCNSLSAPNRIPPEVLSRIFLMVQWRSRARGLGNPGNLAWVRITHVCRHWRETALECTALWTTLSFIHPIFTQVMLDRSKDAPLTVDPTAAASEIIKFQDVLARALSQPERIRSVSLLKVASYYPLDLSFILSKFSGPVPMLEDLYVVGDSKVDLPQGFLKDGAPRLKSMRLSNCRISSWDTLALGSSLTSLHLTSLTKSNTARPSWNVFLSALQRMALLEKLSLTQFLPTESSVPTSSCSLTLPMSLPAVRSVDLTDIAPAVEKFFGVVHLSGSNSLQIALLEVQHVSSLHRFMAQLAVSGVGQRQKPLRLVMFQGQRVNETRFELSFDTKPSRSLCLSFAGPSLITDDVLNILDAEMDFSALIALDFSCDASLTSETFSSVFGGLKRLSYISCSDNSLTQPLLDSLTCREAGEEMPLTESGNDEHPPSCAFPALSTLDLRYEDMSFEDGTSSTPALISALLSRPISCPKLTLNLHECEHINKTLSRRLVRALPQVNVVYHHDPIDDCVPFSDSDADSELEGEGEGESEDGSDEESSEETGSEDEEHGE